jgi:nucleoside-diphosphate-sugar epimerase
MPRPVTLFTGQWADLPLETLARKAAEWGFDGLELACWGDHFEVDKALADDDYVRRNADIAFTRADISKAKRLFDYSPRVSVREGVQRFFDWYQRVIASA